MSLQTLATRLQFRRRLQAADGHQAALAKVLDRLDDGAILTDAVARPLFPNARATRNCLRWRCLRVIVHQDDRGGR